MHIKRAWELMIPLDKYPHMPYWFTLRQAGAEMENGELEINGRKSLPRVILVFDEEYRLLGTVRRRDILRGMEPADVEEHTETLLHKLFHHKKNPDQTDIDSEKTVDAIREHAEQPVGDVMLPIEKTVDYEEPLPSIIHKLVKGNVSLVPVLKDGSVVGVVRSVEVFQEAMSLVTEV